ncbi:MAG: Dabb family protein [Deltaproteobacteria bacterium]|nr:MAG: Dabb family protein [Deltaproteobacteria bacterium]
MIQRVVLIKLNDDEANDDGRARVANHARRVLPLLPGVLAVSVGTPADAGAAGSWDISIVVRFAKLSDFPRYRDDPDHRAFVDQFLVPRTSVIKAWNFDIGDGPLERP